MLFRSVDRSYAPFELVGSPLVLEGTYEADMDAVHVVSGRAVLRTLEREGLEVVETSLPRGARGYWAPPFGFTVLARRTAASRSVAHASSRVPR